jgi:hypothetical protein
VTHKSWVEYYYDHHSLKILALGGLCGVIVDMLFRKLEEVAFITRVELCENCVSTWYGGKVTQQIWWISFSTISFVVIEKKYGLNKISFGD